MRKSQVPVTVLFRIFEIILLVMVITIVYAQVSSISESGIFQKKFIARDLALVMDSITNAKGNLYYFFNPRDIKKFEIHFKKNKIIVDNEAWNYARNNNLDFTHPKIRPKATGLLITRAGNRLTAKDSTKLNFNGYLLVCPETDLQASQIIIDPGHGYNAITGQGEKGFTGAFIESETMLRTSVALQSHLKAGADIKSTRALEIQMLSLPIAGPAPFFAEEAKTTEERIKIIKQNPKAAIISLHAGKNKGRQNFAKAYINKDAGPETQKLACQILNALADEYLNSISGTAIVPVDLSQLSPDNPKQVLLKDRTAVQLELGNVNDAENSMLKNPGKTAKAIAGGIR